MAGGGEPLGVPLDAEDGVFRVLHRLVDAVRRLGRGDEAGGHVADGLVVERIDGDGSGEGLVAKAKGAAQLRARGGEGDGLCGDLARLLLTMWQYGAGELRGEVLVECAAEGHVEELVSATDAEDGEVALAGQADELQLVGIADGVDVLERRHGLLAEQVGTDVATSGQEQAVESVDDRGEDAQLGRGGHEHGRAACQDDGLEVRIGQCLFAVLPIDRDADAWACGGGSVDGCGAVDLRE